jgi:hypothetical protein
LASHRAAAKVARQAHFGDVMDVFGQHGRHEVRDLQHLAPVGRSKIECRVVELVVSDRTSARG